MTAAQYVIVSDAGVWCRLGLAACRGISYDAGAMTRMIRPPRAERAVAPGCVADDRTAQLGAHDDEGKALYPRDAGRGDRRDQRFPAQACTKTEARQLEGYLKRMLENA